MPAPNPARRRVLLDAAIELIAADGLHGLTHRALDRRAGLPVGTVSNYFPSRTGLVVATAQRLAELQEGDLQDAELEEQEGAGRSLHDAVDSIARSLVGAATRQRSRSAAMLELQSEMRRHPQIGAALAPLQQGSEDSTSAHHRRRQLPIPPEMVPVLQALYGGALQALLALPVEQVTFERAHLMARTMIFGVGPGRDQ